MSWLVDGSSVAEEQETFLQRAQEEHAELFFWHAVLPRPVEEALKNVWNSNLFRARL
jgi:hypothetical protein